MIQKIEKTRCQIILVAPFWPSQLWFRPLVDLLMGPPRLLPIRQDIVLNHRGEPFPGAEFLRLTAWSLSGDVTVRSVFHQTLPDWRPPVAGMSTNNTYSNRLGVYFAWCDQKEAPDLEKPEASILAGPLRRRATPLTRLAIEALVQATTASGSDLATIQSVWATAHGEHSPAIKMLAMMKLLSDSV